MSDSVRDQVEDPHAHKEIRTAHSLAEAADSGQSIQGYAAVNGLDEHSEIAAVAYQLFEKSQAEGCEGCAEDDWHLAEREVRKRREHTAPNV
jgi:hypothetical protein